MSNITLDDFNEITLDLSVHRIVNVHCMSGDTNSRKLLITVTNDGEIFPLDSTVEATYKIVKTDGEFVFNPVDEIRSDGKIYIDLTKQSLSFSGVAKSELQLTKGNQIISSMPFNIIVRDSVVNDLTESSDFKSLYDYIQKSKRYDLLTNEIIVGIDEQLPDYLLSGDFYLQEY